MKTVRDTKGNVVYKIDESGIIPETPKDMKTIHKTYREGKVLVNKSRNARF